MGQFSADHMCCVTSIELLPDGECGNLHCTIVLASLDL